MPSNIASIIEKIQKEKLPFDIQLFVKYKSRSFIMYLSCDFYLYFRKV